MQAEVKLDFISFIDFLRCVGSVTWTDETWRAGCHFSHLYCRHFTRSSGGQKTLRDHFFKNLLKLIKQTLCVSRSNGSVRFLHDRLKQLLTAQQWLLLLEGTLKGPDQPLARQDVVFGKSIAKASQTSTEEPLMPFFALFWRGNVVQLWENCPYCSKLQLDSAGSHSLLSLEGHRLVQLYFRRAKNYSDWRFSKWMSRIWDLFNPVTLQD